MGTKWTTEETNRLIELFPTTTLKELSVILKRSYSGVCDKVSTLGLKKSKEYRLSYLSVNRTEAIKACKGKPAWNKLEQLAKVCEICNTNYEVQQHRVNSRYCSSKCRNEWMKTITGANHWHDRKIDCTCKQCGESFRVKRAKVGYGEGIFCSRRCNGSYTSYQLSQHKEPTSIEKKMSNLLHELHITFICEHAIGQWRVDFYIPSLNTVIECDGDYWHSIPKVAARDIKKNADLISKGYNLIRFTETEINNNGIELILKALY